MGQTPRFSDETVLLAEFNHRLCNTLQIIAAMVARCRRDTDGSATPVLLGELEERLRALGALHRLLATTPPPEAFENHCRKLCILLVQAFGRKDVAPWVVMEDINLSAEQTFRVPLLVVELVTNVLKHSLADQNGGEIWVDLRQRRDDIELTVSDSRSTPGPMFAPSPIVKALAQSLEGEAFVKDAGGWVAGALIPSAARRSRFSRRPRGGFRSPALAPEAPAVADLGVTPPNRRDSKFREWAFGRLLSRPGRGVAPRRPQADLPHVRVGSHSELAVPARSGRLAAVRRKLKGLGSPFPGRPIMRRTSETSEPLKTLKGAPAQKS